MEINRINQPTNSNIQEFQRLLKAIQQNNSNNHSHLKFDKNLLSRIMLILQNVDKSLQKTIIKTWTALKLPFNEKNLKGLIRYLQNNPLPSLTEKNAAVKSYAYLLKNNLPLKTPFIKSVSINLHPDKSLSQILTGLPDKGKTPSQIKDNFILDLQKPFAEIMTGLMNYPQKLQDSLLQLAPEENQKTGLLYEYLLGQQTLNMNNNFLLALEIPIHLFNHKQLHPLFLKIAKYKDNSNSDSANGDQGFKINFIIELDKNTIIRSSTLIKEKNIYLQFSTNNNKFAQLIEYNYNFLEKRLQEMGYTINNLHLENLPPLSSKTKDDFLDTILFSNTYHAEQSNYKPVDFRI